MREKKKQSDTIITLDQAPAPPLVRQSMNKVTAIRCGKCGLDSTFGKMVRTSETKWMHIECPRQYQDFVRRKTAIEEKRATDESEKSTQDS